MKRISLILCAALALLAFRGKDKNRQVQGKILQKHEYCGGAAITTEKLAEIQKATPLGGKKCYVRRGNTNSVRETVITTFTSDSAGNFMIYLPPGEYCIVDSRKYDKNYVAEIAKVHKKAGSNFSAADLNCLKAWLLTPDAIITVKAEGENKVEITYLFPCSWNATPCVTYDGPMPP